MYEVVTIYTPGLAQYGYIVYSGNEAAAIDPRRDTEEFHQALAERRLRLLLIFETHSHADLVSGGPQLAHETGADLWISEIVNPDVPHKPLKDGQQFTLGSARITALHTPGHTPEHMCYFVEDLEGGQPPALFSGDLIFVGDLGRPELLGAALAEQLAPQLYESVFGKIQALPMETVVYPGHGAGSLCGKSISGAEATEPTTTLRKEFATSPALQIRDKQAFIEYMTSRQPRVPTNFRRMARLNRAGSPLAVPFHAKRVSPAEVERAISEPGWVVLDSRSQEDFSEGFIPGSIFLGMDDSMPTWLGWLFSPEDSVIVVVNTEADAREYHRWMSRIGYDNLVGYLPGGVSEWQREGRTIASLRVVPPESAWDARSLWDIRTPMEFELGSIPHARSLPLCEIPERMREIPRDEPVTLMCRGGYRGTIAASILLRAGYEMVENVEGGYTSASAVKVGK